MIDCCLVLKRGLRVFISQSSQGQLGLLCVLRLNFKQSLHHFTFSSPFSVTLLHDNEPAPSEILMHDGYYHGYHHFIMKTDGSNITNDIQDFYEEVYDWRKGGSALRSRQSSFYRKKILHSLEFPWLWSVRIRQVKTTRNINTFWRKILETTLRILPRKLLFMWAT